MGVIKNLSKVSGRKFTDEDEVLFRLLLAMFPDVLSYSLLKVIATGVSFGLIC